MSINIKSGEKLRHVGTYESFQTFRTFVSKTFEHNNWGSVFPVLQGLSDEGKMLTEGETFQLNNELLDLIRLTEKVLEVPTIYRNLLVTIQEVTAHSIDQNLTVNFN